MTSTDGFVVTKSSWPDWGQIWTKDFRSFAAIQRFETYKWKGQRFRSSSRHRKHDTAKLLAQLVNNEVEVKSFAEKEPNLEDVFMMVTKGLVS